MRITQRAPANCAISVASGLRKPPRATGHPGYGPDNGTLVNYEAPFSGGIKGAVTANTSNRKTLAAMDLVVFLPLLIIMGAFMFFASRRQKKAMQATIDLHNSLQVGDRIHTTSGLQGTITGITDDDVHLEIAPGVVTRWMKLAVRDRIDPADELDAADSAATEVFDSPVVDTASDPERSKRD